jgi:RNA polymerase sigma-70 factor, ECF subfamily
LAEADATPTATEPELARRLTAGDRGAEAALFQRFAPRVRLYGLRHLRDAAAADDLVQDVLLMTFDSLRAGKVRDVEAIASFVLGSCRRVVAEAHRGAARRQRLLDRFGRDLVPTPGAEEPPLDLDRLTGCLERLSERERSIVVLSFYAERQSDDIGVELGLSPVNVRVVRHRALGRLRSCMGEPS